MEYTTILHLRHVTFAHEGRYQCIITNHFGSTYSSKARLIVNGRLFLFLADYIGIIEEYQRSSVKTR